LKTTLKNITRIEQQNKEHYLDKVRCNTAPPPISTIIILPHLLYYISFNSKVYVGLPKTLNNTSLFISFKGLDACGSKNNHPVDQEGSCPHLLIRQWPPTWRQPHPSQGACQG